jgi:hypothetical protein
MSLHLRRASRSRALAGRARSDGRARGGERQRRGSAGGGMKTGFGPGGSVMRYASRRPPQRVRQGYGPAGTGWSTGIDETGRADCSAAWRSLAPAASPRTQDHLEVRRADAAAPAVGVGAFALIGVGPSGVREARQRVLPRQRGGSGGRHHSAFLEAPAAMATERPRPARWRLGERAPTAGILRITAPQSSRGDERRDVSAAWDCRSSERT